MSERVARASSSFPSRVRAASSGRLAKMVHSGARTSALSAWLRNDQRAFVSVGESKLRALFPSAVESLIGLFSRGKPNEPGPGSTQSSISHLAYLIQSFLAPGKTPTNHYSTVSNKNPVSQICCVALRCFKRAASPNFFQIFIINVPICQCIMTVTLFR